MTTDLKPYPDYKPSGMEWLPSVRGSRHALNAHVTDAAISACVTAGTLCCDTPWTSPTERPPAKCPRSAAIGLVMVIAYACS